MKIIFQSACGVVNFCWNIVLDELFSLSAGPLAVRYRIVGISMNATANQTH